MASKLSPEQVEEFKQAFKLFDANGDGQISPNVLPPPRRNSGPS
jgi:Ca2+-binding EF-hand superfamily protein